MKYLITGGAGLIGSHLAAALLKEGHEVQVLDNHTSGSPDNIRHLTGCPGFKNISADIRDYHALEQAIAGCDKVFHLAAVVGVKRVLEQPAETISTNVTGTQNVLRLAGIYGKKVLVASSSEVYGKRRKEQKPLLNEEDDLVSGPPSKLRWTYACSKVMNEYMARACFEEQNLPVVITRFFNVVGSGMIPGQYGEYGKVIPRFIDCAVRGKAVPVYGDGSQVRSFTHVNDVVKSIMKLMEAKEAEGQVFNVGNYGAITIRELAEKIIRFSGSSSSLNYIPFDEIYGGGFEEIPHRSPDLTKITELIGYRPRYTINDILHEAIDLYQKGELAYRAVDSL